LSYLSIRKENGYPTVRTDSRGRFRFEPVKLGEYVLTVEADGYAPQHRHIKIGTEAKTQDFFLKPGRKVYKRVVDETGRPVPGACVVLNRWHTHTDTDGYFHWSVEAPVPQQVEIRVYKRYSDQYKTLETMLPFSQIERQSIILHRKRALAYRQPHITISSCQKAPVIDGIMNAGEWDKTACIPKNSSFAFKKHC